MSEFATSWAFSTAGRVLFGRGAIAELGNAAARLGHRVVVCSDRTLARIGLVGQVEATLRAAGLEVATFDGGEPEVSRAVVERCADWARERRPDLLIGLGGGSNLDLAKATALLLTHGGPVDRYYGESRVPGPILPVIAVPTTAGTGSEVTPVAVLADAQAALKVGISSHHLLPRWAVVDPMLTVSCPPRVTAYAGMDALSHAIEAYVAAGYAEQPASGLDRVFVGKNPLSDVLALQAIRLIGAHLATAYTNGSDVSAREGMLLGSLMAGMAFANAGTGIIHALQYPLGARTKTAHGLGNALLMPAAMRFNLPGRMREFAAIAGALGVDARGRTESQLAGAAVDAVRDLSASVGIPPDLRAIGVGEADLVALAHQAIGIQRLVRNNPTPVDEAGLLGVLRDALGAGAV